MADARAPVSSGQHPSALTARWTGPLNERSAAALAKALACLTDPLADPERQWLALVRLSGHVAPERNKIWQQHVLPKLGPNAAHIDDLRRMLMEPSATVDQSPGLESIERLMQLCRRLFKVGETEPLLAEVLDRIAYALCSLTIRTPYMTPEQTRRIADMPETIESLDVLLQRGNSWPGAMLKTSLVLLAHSEDDDGAAAARRIVRLLPALGRGASKTLVLPQTLADSLHVLLLHPLILTSDRSELIAGRLARRLYATGNGTLVAAAMDLSQARCDVPADPVSAAHIRARSAMTAAIINVMAPPQAPPRQLGRGWPQSNVVLLSKYTSRPAHQA